MANPRGDRSERAEACAAEVRRLHTVIADWTTGALDNTDENFAAFANALAPDFVIINPSGVEENREQVIPRFLGLYAARAGRGFRIEIREPILRHDLGERALVTYREHWFEGERETSVIFSTALLQLPNGGTGGTAWLHLHETWLRSPATRERP